MTGSKGAGLLALCAAAALFCGGCRSLPPGRAPEGGLVETPLTLPENGLVSEEAACNIFATDLTAVALQFIDGDLVFQLVSDRASQDCAERMFRTFRNTSGARLQSRNAPYRIDSRMILPSGVPAPAVWQVQLSRANGQILYFKSLQITYTL